MTQRGSFETRRTLRQLLGTPDEHKRHVVADGGHDVPRALLIRETLDWRWTTTWGPWSAENSSGLRSPV